MIVMLGEAIKRLEEEFNATAECNEMISVKREDLEVLLKAYDELWRSAEC